MSILAAVLEVPPGTVEQVLEQGQPVSMGGNAISQASNCCVSFHVLFVRICLKSKSVFHG